MKNITLLLLISSITIFGQRGNISRFDTQIGSITSDDNVLSKFYRLNQFDNESISGSRFIFPDFKQRGVLYINNKAYSGYGLNIDAINNDIVSIVGADSILVYEKFKIDSIRINNKIFKKNNNNVFFEVLAEGKNISFLKKYNGSITEGYKNVMKGTTEKESYKITNTYYLKKGDDYTIIKLKKKEILVFLKDNAKNITTFAKDKKLSFKKEGDLVKIFNYYNTL